jgi:restriction system protein
MGLVCWFVLVLIITFIGLVVAAQQGKQGRTRTREQFLLESAFSRVDSMTGTQFEEYVAQLLRHRGFSSVNVVGGAADGGVDILAVSPDGTSAAFQCKRQTSNVGVQVVRQLIGSVSHEHRGRVPFLVTTASLTKDGARLAIEADVSVIDRSVLGTWMSEIRAQLLTAAQDGGLDPEPVVLPGSEGASATAIPLDIVALVEQGRKIEAIKRYRQLSDVGLRKPKKSSTQSLSTTPIARA